MAKDIIQRGYDSQLLKDNPVFMDAVQAVVDKFSLVEEAVLHSDLPSKEIERKIVRYAMLRRAAMDIVTELDGFIFDAEQAKDDPINN